MSRKSTKSLQSRVASYSALAGTMIAAANQANAQVVYTDITPDTTVNTNGGTYDLDLNNDGTFDFNFTLQINAAGSSSTPAFNKVAITPLNSNAIAGGTPGAYTYPTAMNTGDSIQASLIWNVGSSQSMAYAGTGAYGNWVGATDKFVGLQINVSGSIYYGWARLDVDSAASSFTIKDYAYRTVANLPIVAGASNSTGIQQQAMNNLLVFNENRLIHIRNKNGGEAMVSISNALGQEVMNKSIEGPQAELELADVAAGVYLVHIGSGTLQYTKKIIIN